MHLKAKTRSEASPVRIWSDEVLLVAVAENCHFLYEAAGSGFKTVVVQVNVYKYIFFPQPLSPWSLLSAESRSCSSCAAMCFTHGCLMRLSRPGSIFYI